MNETGIVFCHVTGVAFKQMASEDKQETPGFGMDISKISLRTEQRDLGLSKRLSFEY